MKLTSTLFCIFTLFSGLASATEYLPFAIQKTVGIGIQADLNANGQLEIKGLVPGAPADVEGSIKVGDIVTAVQSDPSAKFVEITGMKLQDIAPLFKGNDGVAINLKMDRAGTAFNVELIRAEFEFDDGQE